MEIRSHKVSVNVHKTLLLQKKQLELIIFYLLNTLKEYYKILLLIPNYILDQEFTVKYVKNSGMESFGLNYLYLANQKLLQQEVNL